ncbi:molybdenum cofactor guanylyltransferase [Roseivirga misakiensis]|uniref:MobA-like NTP transferase domain-containing protein n=1 Tax=Roseivirga misakiensis TaxID=1563681 RepID=A0A1E5T0H3_9BACT|nr:molybdenum cofactor guanylyltransferase [Roseivirga misakiensis]OEK04880.1 hypothetical protein BFP71_15690 [Roseivirga misakiensis]
MANSAVKGVILLGGQSSRMGSDKAFLEWNGQKVLDILYERVALLSAEVWLSVNSSQYANLTEHYQCIQDRYEKIGPMGGILSALETLESDLLVVAIDMPSINVETLKPLISAGISTNKPTAYFSKNSLWQPLPSFWPKSCSKTLNEHISTYDYALNKYLEAYGNGLQMTHNEVQFHNINRPSDLP